MQNARCIQLTPGEKYGRLTIIERVENDKRRRAMWKCKCDCGKEVVVMGIYLKNGKTKSCGCYQKDVAKKHILEYNASPEYHQPSHTIHGKHDSRMYTIWCNMKQRCSNPNHEKYGYYGARGISVCEEWKNDFQSFYDWSIANGYTDELTIDRIDSAKGYSPDNCRWVTQKEQTRNRSITVRIEHDGEIKTLKEWCEQYNFDYKLAHARYKKGWSFEELFKPKWYPRQRSATGSASVS